MPRYYRESNYHRQIRFIKIVKRTVIVLLFILAVVGAVIAFDALRSAKNSDQSSAPSTPIKSTFESNLEIYRTQYFQFQTNSAWRAIANESTADKFVYRKFNEKLVEAQLDIYVNQPADSKINANRVLPVTFSEKSDKLNAAFVSEHCAKDVKNKGYKTMILQGVNFRCNTDTTDYSVLVGKEAGDTQLKMLRPSTEPVVYVIHYRDLRAIPTPDDIEAIINTFQTR
jgi:hypothetical protein